MKKRVWTSIILGVVGAVIIAFAVMLLLSAPIYDNFTKEVKSYEKLQAEFADSQTIFLPSEDEIPAVSYTFRLDGRNCRAKPIAYYISKEETYSNTRISYYLGCGGVQFSPLGEVTQTYGGVDILSKVRTYETGSCSSCFNFNLTQQDDHMNYHLEGWYPAESLTDAEITELNAHIQEMLEKYGQEIIDQYNANNKDSAA